MKKITLCFKNAAVIFSILFVASFVSSRWTPTAVTAIGACFCTIGWVVSGNITKSKTSHGEVKIPADEALGKTLKTSKSEFRSLRKKRLIIWAFGGGAFALGLNLYTVFIEFEKPHVAYPAGMCAVAGLIVFILGFSLEKFAFLKYEKYKTDYAPAPGCGLVSGTLPGRSFETVFKDQTVSVKRNVTSESARKGLSPAVRACTVSGTAETVKKPFDRVENDRILGCMIGGAAGDALGYPVEFLKYDAIVEEYGTKGITCYSVDRVTNKALISDDTQMTLFTAEGLLQQEGEELKNIYNAYNNWLLTQNTKFADRPFDSGSKLLQRPELFSRRAPGNTCISALTFGKMGTVTDPINSSKGCGGLMRVAPIAFLNYLSPLELDKLAAQAAATTHGHPLGYLPAALLVHILHKAIYDNYSDCLTGAVIKDSINEFSALFSSAPYLDELLTHINKAIALSTNKKKDIDNIKTIGEGWVAEETLAIAIYSALRHHDDFSAALAASVNHDGDSDSTGAVTGNILGAVLGNSRIDLKWKEHLELYDLIEKTAKNFFI